MTGLGELAGLRDQLAQRRRDAEQAVLRERAAREARERERRYFADAVGPVTPTRSLPAPPRTPPTPEPRQRQQDERDALQQAQQGGVDSASLLLTDGALSFRRPDISEDVLVRLRRGHWAIQAELDLHGMRRDEARLQLAEFVRQASRRGQRCLRVVHGKGTGSPGREPVLKGKVQRWLAMHASVIAFAQASGVDGGAGAVIVLLGDGVAGNV